MELDKTDIKGQHDDVDIYVDPKKRMGLVIVIMAALMGSLVWSYGLASAMVAIGTELNNLAMVAWLFTAANIVQMVMNPLIPGITAKVPMPKLILISLILGIISSAGFMFASSMAVMIICRAIAGFVGAVIFTGGLAFAGQIMPPAKRPMVTGLQMVFNGIGSMAGPLIAATCVDAGNWRMWMAVAVAMYATAVSTIAAPIAATAVRSAIPF